VNRADWEVGPDAAEQYRAALVKIFREVCELPWTVNGRKAWIRHICQEALGVRYPHELPEQDDAPAGEQPVSN
jgi:hypothetical protein